MTAIYEATDHPDREDLHFICYWPNAILASDAEDAYLPEGNLGKCGSWDDVPLTKAIGMLYLTTLPLAGGQGGDDRVDRPEAETHDPDLPNPLPEDEALATEHAQLFDVNVMQSLYLNIILFLKHTVSITAF